MSTEENNGCGKGYIMSSTYDYIKGSTYDSVDEAAKSIHFPFLPLSRDTTLPTLSAKI